MSHNPLVSVIIPCFNSERYLEDCIESALAQTYRNTEVIVVDDASTDGSLRDARRFERQIQVIANPRNMERSWSRNRGIEASSGSLIAFLDADDLWHNDAVAVRVDFMLREARAALVYAKARWIGESGEPYVPERIVGHAHDGEGALAMPGTSGFICSNRAPCMTVMLRREVFDEVGRFNPEPWLQGAEDYDLWLRISDRYPIGYLDEVIASYRVHAMQTTTDKVSACERDVRLRKRHLKRSPCRIRYPKQSDMWRPCLNAMERLINTALWQSRDYAAARKLSRLYLSIAPMAMVPYRRYAAACWHELRNHR